MNSVGHLPAARPMPTHRQVAIRRRLEEVVSSNRKQHRLRWGSPGLAIAIGISLVGGGAAAAGGLYLTAPVTVTVPDFVGTGLPSLSLKARNADVTIHMRYVTSDKPTASVISQSPPAGTRLPAGGVVLLTLSDGSTPEPVPGENVVVPNVIGLLLNQAVSTLHRAGITDSFGTTTCIVGTTHVVAQFPVAGSSVPQGTRISLSCS
jgi:beta-lactam-binding protein with PASTA domain